MSQPNFDLGINDLACFQMSDFSSSGDERIIRIDMDEIVINSKELELPVKTEEQKEAEATNQTQNQKRFVKTTADERDRIIIDVESKNTKKMTKYAVNLFKG